MNEKRKDKDKGKRTTVGKTFTVKKHYKKCLHTKN